MTDLKEWVREQGLTVRAFAEGLDVPLKTAQDWVYRGVAPTADNQARLDDYVLFHCAHHWLIDVPSGPTSGGVCQRCGHVNEFQNSLPDHRHITINPERKKRVSAQ